MFLQFREKMKARRSQIRRICGMRQQFKLIIMDFNHRLYGCVNMRVVLVEKNFFSACLDVSPWLLLVNDVKRCNSKLSLPFCPFRYNPPGWHPLNPRKQMPSLFGLLFWLWSIMMILGFIHGHKHQPFLKGRSVLFYRTRCKWRHRGVYGLLRKPFPEKCLKHTIPDTN